MNFIKKLKFKNKEIYYIKIDKFLKDNYNNLIKKFCNYDDILRINKYYFEYDRYRHLSSIVLQKYVIKKFTNYNNDYKDIFIKRTPNNKPYYSINNNIIHYNVSHDKDIIIIIFSERSVGIDIMSIDKKNITENLLNKSCYKDEINIDKLKLWTLIESYYKATGQGIIDINNRNFFFKDINKEFVIFFNCDNKENYIFNTFQIEDYIISISEVK